MSLSDLDLVQQAMAPTEPANARGNSSVASNGAPTSHSTNTSNGAHSISPTETANTNPTPANTANAPTPADTNFLAGIDLSELTPADRAALAPIINALRAAGSGDDGDVDVDGILKQLEAADDVADALEGRLDSLLANLGELEADAQGEGEGAGDKA